MRPGSNSDADDFTRGETPPGVSLPASMFDDEDTPPISASPPTARDIAIELSGIMAAGPPPPPPPPPIDLKKLSKKNWLANLLIALVVAGAGALAAYKATESRSIDNQESVKKNAKAIQGNSEAIGELTGSVDDLTASVGEGRDEQKILIQGVDALKLEAQTEKQTRLEEKVIELERKNRRLERENR